ncbi:MAG: hypothetical protein ACRC46_15545 [Thermoguttaceae bacterium]
MSVEQPLRESHPFGLSFSLSQSGPCRRLVLIGRDLAAVYRFLCDNDFADNVAMMTLFLRDMGLKQRLRSELGGLFESAMPAITFVPQKPCDGAAYWFELVAFAGDEVTLERSCPGRAVNVTINRSDSETFCLHFVGDVVPPPAPIGAYARSFAAFEELEKSFKASGASIEQTVRTWLYQGHLTGRDTDHNTAPQRYHELNRARADFFRGHKFLGQFLPAEFGGTTFPASTGIGSDDWDITVSGLAVSAKAGGVRCTPLENPKQNAAFQYDKNYGVESPRFVRAMALTQDDFGWVFVSGTASIVDSESVHAGDPVAQTHQTLDNIAALIAAKNLSHHGVKAMGATLHDLAVARVYIKRPQDVVAIEAVCRERMPLVPLLFTQADVCRPDLLVEIEGWASLRNQ